MTRILFIVDCRKTSGYGHLSRSSVLCKSLASHLDIYMLPIMYDKSEYVLSFLENLEVSLVSEIQIRSIQFTSVILDSYVDEDINRFIKCGRKSFLICDKPDEKHRKFDYIIDINLNNSLEEYLSEGFRRSQLLIGKGYNLLNPDVYLLRSTYEINKAIRVVGIYLGAQNEETYENVLARIINRNYKINVFSRTNLNTRLENINLIPFSKNFLMELAKCDVIIGSAGTNGWERAAIGLPSVYLSFDELHTRPLNILEEIGFGIRVNSTEEIDVDILSFRYREQVRDRSFDYFNSDGTRLLANKIIDICVA